MKTSCYMFKNRFLFLLTLAFALLAPEISQAQLNTKGAFPNQRPSVNRSVRALGMGNAFIAVKGNHDSPFYNPAGLNDIEEGRISFFGLTGEISKRSLELFGDVADLIDAVEAANSDSDRIDALDDFVTPRFGEFSYMRFGVELVSYVRKNFATGFIFEERLNFAFRDQAVPKFDVQNIADLVWFISGSYNFFDKLIQVGGTLRPTIRSSINERINSATAIANEVDDVFQTLLYPHFGVGFDLGFKSDLKIPQLMEFDIYKRVHAMLSPSFAMTWQNIGTTFYDVNIRDSDGNNSGVEDATKFVNAVNDEVVVDKSSFSIGAAVSPKLWILDTNVALDFRGLDQDGDALSKMYFGVEAIFPMILSARVGVSQGYFAGGVGLDFKFVKVDFASYAEEVGIFDRQGSDRRYALTLNFGF